MSLSLPITDGTLANYGAMIPERVLDEVLGAGFKALQSDVSLIDDLLHKLDKSALTDVKNYFSSHKVTVRMNIPHDAIVFPIVAIVNGSDAETAQYDFLGDAMGYEVDTAKSNLISTIGHTVQSRYNLYCLSGRDSNAALWLYYITKAIIMLNLQELDKHGMYNIMFNGQDIHTREDLLPEFTYARILSIDTVNIFSVRQTEKVVNKLVVNIKDDSGNSSVILNGG